MGFLDSIDIERLVRLPIVPLGTWPTPLERIDDPKIGPMFIKRDDLAGFGGKTRSGVKARKIEGLLAHMRDRDLKKLTLPLGNITNLGPELIHTAQQVGIEVDLMITNLPILPDAIRETLFAPIRSHVTFFGRSSVAAAARLFGRAIRSILAKDGSLVLPPSPAHPVSIAGTARGYFEAMSQCWAETGTLPSCVYVASASGSTVAGFMIGEALMRAAGAPAVRIVAVTVSEEPIQLWLSWFVRWTIGYFDLNLPDTPQVTICRVPENLAYARFSRVHKDICHRVFETHALSIDPIYGAKSWLALERHETVGRTPQDGRIPMFWHCGFTPNWPLFDVAGLSSRS
jgi:1-aminocyclopropane-1-carboxylate deaminase/D-cysteine desulfhydrase-like pyridoxal-dependent ACC family enzyme